MAEKDRSPLRQNAAKAAREARLADELRANLRRRKDQSRARAEVEGSLHDTQQGQASPPAGPTSE